MEAEEMAAEEGPQPQAEEVETEDRRQSVEGLTFMTPLEVERNELGYQLEEVRGKTLRVIRTDCPGSTCRIFFVHGGGGRAGQFKHQIKALKKDFHVIAVDFLGHGDSPRPNRPALYTANEHFEDLLAIYERYKSEQNIIVAHCFGATHSLRLLKYLSSKDRLGEVCGIVMLALGNTAPTGGPMTVFVKLPAFVLEFARRFIRSSAAAVLWSPRCDPAIIEFENEINDNNRMYMMKVLAAECGDQRRWDAWITEGQEALSTSSIPRAMICGESDGVFSLQSCEQVRGLLDVPGDCFHVVKESAHLMMLEKPDEVTKIIREFIIEGAKITPATTRESENK